jgi:hypothetical protein
VAPSSACFCPLLVAVKRMPWAWASSAVRKKMSVLVLLKA